MGESVVCGGELVSVLLAGLAARGGNTEIRYMDCGSEETGSELELALLLKKIGSHFVPLLSLLHISVQLYCNND